MSDVGLSISIDIHFRATILAEALRHFIGLVVGETAAILSNAKVECGGGSFPRN